VRNDNRKNSKPNKRYRVRQMFSEHSVYNTVYYNNNVFTYDDEIPIYEKHSPVNPHARDSFINIYLSFRDRKIRTLDNEPGKDALNYRRVNRLF